MYTGANIVRDGLVLAVDAGSERSFFGEPTTNLVPDMNLNGMSGISLNYIGLEDGWKKYGISGTWSSDTYPYSMYLTPTSFTGGVIYSTHCYIKTNVLSKFEYFGSDGVMYVNAPLQTNGVAQSIIQPDGSKYVSRIGFSYVSTISQNGYLRTKPLANGTTFVNTTDFVYIKEGQIEQKDHATPFVNGTRGSSVDTGGGWKDLSGYNNHGVLSSGTTATNNIVFHGGSDNIIVQPTYPSLDTNNYSVDLWFNSNVPVDTLGVLFHSGYYYLYLFNTTDKNIYFVNRQTSTNTWLSTQYIFTRHNLMTNIVCVRNIDIISIYENGVLKNSLTNTTMGTQNTSWYIGSASTGSGFSGEMANFKIYNNALTPTEVLQNFNAQKSRFGL